MENKIFNENWNKYKTTFISFKIESKRFHKPYYFGGMRNLNSLPRKLKKRLKKQIDFNKKYQLIGCDDSSYYPITKK